MIRTVALLSVLPALLLSVASPALAEDGMAVKAVALAVTGEVDEEAFDFSPLQGQTGTRVTLALDASGLGATIVGLDDDATKVNAFTDDRGTDLLEEKKDDGGMFSISFGSSPIGAFPKVSKDGKMIVLDVEGPKTPAAGSNAVKIDATVVLNVASGTKTREAKNLALKPGAVVDEEGGITLDSTGQPDWGDAAMSVTLKMPSATLDQIAKLTFYDADGNDITEGQSSSMIMMNRAEVVWNLTQKVDNATVELTLHDGMKKIEVPVDLSVTLGL